MLISHKLCILTRYSFYEFKAWNWNQHDSIGQFRNNGRLFDVTYQ